MAAAAHKRAQAAIRRERARAQQYLDIAGVILLALDLQGRITLINRKGCSLLGWEERDLLGARLDRYLPSVQDNGFAPVFFP